MLSGDAGDPGFATEVTRGATAIYHCMNPAYSTAVWSRELPRLMTSLLEAAARNRSRLVVLDNLYMFGPMSGKPMNEDTPVAPSSRKGEIRARVAGMALEAHRTGRARVTIGRACDYYGPGGVQTYFGEMFWRRVLAGRSAQVLTPPDVPHTFHLTTDVAAGLATLGTDPDDDVCGRWWMLPAARAIALRGLVDAFGRALGRRIPIQRVPAAVLGVMGWFVPLLRELPEMRYQWTEPYLIDDRRFRTRFGLAPTPIEQGAVATVAWARATFGVGR
jgi:nucleoside-diphosphate-sugar epimerase